MKSKAYTTIGTEHFVSVNSAVQYYSEYGYDISDVNAKIKLGEIKIGSPKHKSDESLILVDGGKRYAICKYLG